MANNNKTSAQDPAKRSGPAIIDRKADKRPDLGISVGSSGGTQLESSHPTGMIPETVNIDPKNTDELTSNEENGTSDTVPGKRVAAGSDE
jgi:hypothetical protein